MRQSLVAGILIGGATIAAGWWAIGLYSGGGRTAPPDPRHLAVVRSLLARSLAGDSAGAARLAATAQPIAWTTSAIQQDSVLVRKWSIGGQPTGNMRRGDTAFVSWRTNARVGDCGRGEITATLLERADGPRVLRLGSPCITAVPITFELGVPESTSANGP